MGWCPEPPYKRLSRTGNLREGFDPLSVHSMQDSLICLTVSTRFHRGVQNYLNSCEVFGVTPVVLGYGQKFQTPSTKLELVLDFAKEVFGYKKWILFTDCWDVLFVAPPSDILKAHLDCGGVPLFFGAEKNCWPDKGMASRFPSDKFPAEYPNLNISNSVYRYLNSGCYIAETKYLITVLEWILSRRDASNKYFGDDQWLFMDFYAQNPIALFLDTKCGVFQNLYDAESDVDYSGERVYNKVTGSYPKIIHANGTTSTLPAERWLLNHMDK